MKNYIPIFLISIIIILTGCMPILMYHSGIRIPKDETPQSISAFALKMNQDPVNIYVAKDSASFIDLSNDHSVSKNLFSAIVYSKKGMLLNYKDSSSCQWSAANYLSMLKPDSSYRIDTSAKADFLLSRIMPLYGGLSPVFDTSEYDFVVIMTWAKFITKFNARLFPVLDSAKASRKARIMAISLNMDMQKSWDLKGNDRTTLRVK